MKTIYTQEAYINLEQIYFIWYEEKMKFNMCLRFFEEKGEFGSPRNEFLSFKWDTPIMFGLL
jgi:hypothetical protein